MRLRPLLLVAPALLGAGLVLAAPVDELSGADRLRVLYSTQFTFTPAGLPLVTVQLMEGQREVIISGDGGGVRVLPEGEGGAEVVGAPPWRITLEGGRPARVKYWVVVARLPAAQGEGVRAAIATWRGRGFTPRTFEVGTVFGIAGEVLDSRETLVVVAPHAELRPATTQAGELAARHAISTGVHPELLERPQGTLVATDARGTVVRNPSLLWFAPRGGRLRVQRVEYGVGYRNHGFEDRSYFGTLYVTVDRLGTLAVVNAAPEDKLLAGLVPAEIFPSAPVEALKAQAVTARGELLAKIGTRHLVDPYRLCSAQHCQVYSGAGHEHPRTTAAVAATRGEVLFVEGEGRLVDTVYSAACGGFSEHNESIWNMRPDRALRGHLDAEGGALAALQRFAGGLRTDSDVAAFLATPAAAFCKLASMERGQRYRWTARRSVPELSRLLAVDHPGVGTVRDLQPLERGVSGRIRALKVVGDKGEAVLRGDLYIRTQLGGLKSSLFVVARPPTGAGRGEFLFQGGGWGHGVGMCQTGAIGMAERGHAYGAILKHYYQGSRLRKLY